MSAVLETRGACLYRAWRDRRVSGQSDGVEGARPALRLDAVAEDVLDVADEDEEVGLDFGEDAAGEAGLEGLGVALALAGGALDEPVVDELLVRGGLEEEEVVEHEFSALPGLARSLDGREERNLLALVDVPELEHVCVLVLGGVGVVEELADEGVGGEGRVELGRLFLCERGVLEAAPPAEEAEEVAFGEVDLLAAGLAEAGEVWVVGGDVLVAEEPGRAGSAACVADAVVALGDGVADVVG